MHHCLKFILFWNDTLHVSDGLSVHHQELRPYIRLQPYVKQILLLLASKHLVDLTTDMYSIFYKNYTILQAVRYYTCDI